MLCALRRAASYETNRVKFTSIRHLVPCAFFFSPPLRSQPVVDGRTGFHLLRALGAPRTLPPGARVPILETRAGFEALDSISTSLESNTGAAWNAGEAASCLTSIIALGGGRVGINPPPCLRSVRTRRALRLLTMRIYQRWDQLPLADAAAAAVALDAAGVTFEPLLRSFSVWANALAIDVNVGENFRCQLDSLEPRLRSALVGSLSRAAAVAQAKDLSSLDILNFASRLISTDTDTDVNPASSMNALNTNAFNTQKQLYTDTDKNMPPTPTIQTIQTKPFYYDYSWHRTAEYHKWHRDLLHTPEPLLLPLWFCVPVEIATSATVTRDTSALVPNASAIASLYRASRARAGVNAVFDARINTARTSIAKKLILAATDDAFSPQELVTAACAAPALQSNPRALACIMAPLASSLLSAITDKRLAVALQGADPTGSNGFYGGDVGPAQVILSQNKDGESATNIFLTHSLECLDPSLLISAMCSFSASVLALAAPAAGLVSCTELDNIIWSSGKDECGAGGRGEEGDIGIDSHVDALVKNVPILISLAGVSLYPALRSGSVSHHDVARLLAAYTAVGVRPPRMIALLAAKAAQDSTTLSNDALVTLTWATAFSPSFIIPSSSSNADVTATTTTTSSSSSSSTVPARYATRLADAHAAVMRRASSVEEKSVTFVPSSRWPLTNALTDTIHAANQRVATLSPTALISLFSIFACAGVAVPVIETATLSAFARPRAIDVLSTHDRVRLSFATALIAIRNSGKSGSGSTSHCNGETRAILSAAATGRGGGGASPSSNVADGGLSLWLCAMANDTISALRVESSSLSPTNMIVNVKIQKSNTRIHQALTSIAPFLRDTFLHKNTSSSTETSTAVIHGARLTSAPSIGRIALAFTSPTTLRAVVITEKLDSALIPAATSPPNNVDDNDEGGANELLPLPATLFIAHGVPSLLVKAVETWRTGIFTCFGLQVVNVSTAQLLNPKRLRGGVRGTSRVLSMSSHDARVM